MKQKTAVVKNCKGFTTVVPVFGSMSAINRDIDLIVIVRKEQDSNLRSPLGAYTLSRRASSTTRAPFLICQGEILT